MSERVKPVSTTRWRLQYESQGYGCKDDSGSLKPVPPGESRRSLGFCELCRAERCLFGGLSPLGKVKARERQEAKREAGRLKALEAALVAGERLSCWDCVHARAWNGGYVCRLHPDEDPVTQEVMAATFRPECGCFEPRRGEVQAATTKVLDMARRNVRYRAQGLSTSRKPLTEHCWNCVHVRRNGLYVCRFAPEDSVGMQVMLRREPCERFELRRSVIVLTLGYEYDGVG